MRANASTKPPAGNAHTILIGLEGQVCARVGALLRGSEPAVAISAAARAMPPLASVRRVTLRDMAPPCAVGRVVVWLWRPVRSGGLGPVTQAPAQHATRGLRLTVKMGHRALLEERKLLM